MTARRHLATTLLASAPLLLLLAPASAQDADDAAPEPLPALVDRWPAAASSWTPRPFLLDITEPPSSEPEETEPESLHGPLTAWLAPWLGANGIATSSDDGELVLEGDEIDRDGARNWLAAARRFVRGRSVLSVAVLDLPDDVPLDVASVREAVASGAADVDWPVRLVCERGRPERAERLDTRNIVARLDVEVAMGAAVSDPIAAWLVAGDRIDVVARPTAPDAARVTFALHRSRVTEPVRRVELNSGTVELPEAPFTAVRVPLDLTVGTPVLVAVPGPGGRGTLAAVVTLESVDAPATPGTLLVDVAALAGPVARPPAPHPLGARSERADEEDGGEETPDESADDAGRLRVLAQLDRAGVEVLDGSSALAGVRADHEGLADILRGARGRSAVVARACRSAAWTSLRANKAFDPLRMGLLESGTDAAALGGDRAPGRLLLPVHGADTAHVVHGTYRRFVSDFEVEVAQDVGITAAVIDTHLDGESIAVALDADGRAIVRWNRVRLLRADTRALTIIRDTGAGASAVTPDQVDVLVTRSNAGALEVGTQPAVEVERQDDRARIDVWTVR